MKNSVLLQRSIVMCISALFLASAPAAVTGLEQASLGMIVDEQGKPLNRAFVWLEADPRVCDFTKKDGKFRLEAGDHPANAIVLASAAGKDGARMRLGDLRKAAGRIVLKQEDPEFTKIEVGAALAFTKCAAASTMIPPRLLTKTEIECGMAYVEFLKKEGNALVNTMLSKGSPDPAIGGKCHYIIIGEIAARSLWYKSALKRMAGSRPVAEQPFWKGLGQGLDHQNERYRSFTDALEKDGKEALITGYAGQPLTLEELKKIRYWNCFHASYHNLCALITEIGKRGLGWRGEFKIGDTLLPLRFHKLEEILARPEYSDAPTLSLTEFLRPEGLASFLKYRLSAYGVVTGPDGGTVCQLRILTGKGVAPSVNVLEECSSKPVLLCNWCPGDRFAYNSMDHFEFLYRAYREQLSMFLIASVSGGYADAYVDEFQFFGGHPEEEPLRGLACQQNEPIVTVEQRARQVKQVFMEKVFLSIPVLLDNHDGLIFHNLSTMAKSGVIGHHGVIATGLLDKKGMLVAGTGFLAGDWGFQLPKANYYVPHITMAYLEQEIRSLLQQGGNGPSTTVPVVTLDPQRNLLMFTPFTVKSVDAEKGIVTAWPGAGNNRPTEAVKDQPCTKEFIFRMVPDARIISQQWMGNVMRRSSDSIANLKPGTTIYADIILDRPVPKWKADPAQKNKELLAKFPLDEYACREVKTLRLITSHIGLPTSAFFGKVTVRDAKSITVECGKAELEKFGGWRFWQAMGDKANVNTHPSLYIPTKTRLGILDKMLDEPGKTVKRIFAIDRAVRISRNGILQDMNKLGLAVEVGDYVMVQYEYSFELQNDQIIWPEWIWAAAPIQGESR